MVRPELNPAISYGSMISTAATVLTLVTFFVGGGIAWGKLEGLVDLLNSKYTALEARVVRTEQFIDRDAADTLAHREADAKSQGQELARIVALEQGQNNIASLLGEIKTLITLERHHAPN